MTSKPHLAGVAQLHVTCCPIYHEEQHEVSQPTHVVRRFPKSMPCFSNTKHAPATNPMYMCIRRPWPDD